MALDTIDLLKVLQNSELSKKIPDLLQRDFGDNWENFKSTLIPILNNEIIRIMSVSRPSPSSYSTSSSTCDTPLSLSPLQGGLVPLNTRNQQMNLSPARSAFKPCKTIIQILNDLKDEVIAQLPPLQAVEDKNITWQSLYEHFIKNIVPAIDSISQLEQKRQEQQSAELCYEQCQEAFSNKIVTLKSLREKQNKKPFVIESIHQAVFIKCKIHPGLLSDDILEDLLTMKYVFVYIELPKYEGVYKLGNAGTELIRLDMSKVDFDTQSIMTFPANSSCLLEKLDFNKIYLLSGPSSLLFLDLLPEVPKKMSPVASKKPASRSTESSNWLLFFFGSKSAQPSLDSPSGQVKAISQVASGPVGSK